MVELEPKNGTGSSSRCSTQPGCASRKPASCAGEISRPAAAPARSSFMAREAGRASYCCRLRVWGPTLAALRATASLDAPVFASRSGKALERSRVARSCGMPACGPGSARMSARTVSGTPTLFNALDRGADSFSAGNAGPSIGGHDEPVLCAPRPGESSARVPRSVSALLIDRC